MEEQNAEFKKIAESLITDVIDLNKTVEAMGKEIEILKVKLSQQRNPDFDDTLWYEYYRSHSNLHLQQHENRTNWESTQRLERCDHIEVDDNSDHIEVDDESFMTLINE